MSLCYEEAIDSLSWQFSMTYSHMTYGAQHRNIMVGLLDGVWSQGTWCTTLCERSNFLNMLSFKILFEYVCGVYPCVHVHVMCAGASIHVKTLFVLNLIFWDRMTHRNWSSQTGQGWLACSWDLFVSIYVPTHQDCKLQICIMAPGSYVSAGDMNSSFPPWKASTLPTEPIFPANMVSLIKESYCLIPSIRHACVLTMPPQFFCTSHCSFSS